MSLKRRFNVDGMSCQACEIHIEQELKKHNKVKCVEADYVSSVVEITLKEHMTKADLEELVESTGYSITSNSLAKKSIWSISAGVLFLILLFGKYFDFGQMSLDSTVGYGVIFMIGLLTSLHCITMCGGINIAVNSRKVTSITVGKPLSKYRSSFLYNFGRVTSYTIIGGLVGLLGSVLSFSDFTRGVISSIAALFMILIGLKMIGLIPKFSVKISGYDKVAKWLFNSEKQNGAFIVGLVNGFMPCGPLQMMQLYALGTGSFVKGALAMFIFSLGTVPLMLGLSIVSTHMRHQYSKYFVKVGAVLIVVMGVVMFNRGIALAGYSQPVQAVESSVSGVIAYVESDTDFQTVQVDIQKYTYEPIVLQKGIPVNLNFYADAENLNSCNGALQIPEYNVKLGLIPGDNMVVFTPTETGVYTYSCWMGMITSEIIVVDDIEDL